MNNCFGHLFRVSTFGESHGGAVGVVIDGCPPGHKISIERIQAFLDRRRPGQSHLSTPRAEEDQVTCLSGLAEGISLGTPIALLVNNKDAKAHHYNDLKDVYRPSHADYTSDAKFGVKAPSGGGRSSARETIGRVAAAAVAEQVLESLVPGFSVVAYVESVKGISAEIGNPVSITREDVDKTPTRCPDPLSQQAIEDCIIEAKKKGDSVGGVIYCSIRECPVGLGSPVFDKLEAELAKGMMSLPASKGFEVGSGFASTYLYGSEHNDSFINDGGRIRTESNLSGGIQGGISNGEEIYMRIAFKPVATIFQKQKTVDREGNAVEMKPKQGRHDPCVLPRAVPMVEAMALIVIMDQYLRQMAVKASSGPHRV